MYLGGAGLPDLKPEERCTLKVEKAVDLRQKAKAGGRVGQGGPGWTTTGEALVTSIC